MFLFMVKFSSQAAAPPQPPPQPSQFPDLLCWPGICSIRARGHIIIDWMKMMKNSIQYKLVFPLFHALCWTTFSVPPFLPEGGGSPCASFGSAKQQQQQQDGNKQVPHPSIHPSGWIVPAAEAEATSAFSKGILVLVLSLYF